MTKKTMTHSQCVAIVAPFRANRGRGRYALNRVCVKDGKYGATDGCFAVEWDPEHPEAVDDGQYDGETGERLEDEAYPDLERVLVARPGSEPGPSDIGFDTQRLSRMCEAARKACGRYLKHEKKVAKASVCLTRDSLILRAIGPRGVFRAAVARVITS